MAVLRVQENIKNANGTYDTVHKETEASLVLFDDNETFQQKYESGELTGPMGVTGTAAGFGTPTASVDANVGTPSVTVTASGPNTAKVFNFKFNNLKGATGATGATGTTGPRGPGSNPHWLDNWYFADPINQRGGVEYTGAGYTIDRWYLRSDGTSGQPMAKLALESGGIRITRSSGNGLTALNQRMETPSDFFGKKMTISVLITENTSNTPGYFGAWRSNGVGLNSNNAIVSTIPAGATGLFTTTGTFPADLGSYSGINIGLNVAANTNINVKIAAIKLELGDQQTLAHQEASGNWVLNDPPPNKALELAKCQRFYVVIRDESLHYTSYGTMLCYGNKTSLSCFLPLPVTMRAHPSLINLSPYSNWYIRGLSSDVALELMPSSGIKCVNGIMFSVTKLAWVDDPPEGSFFSILAPSESGAGVEFSADL